MSKAILIHRNSPFAYLVGLIFSNYPIGLSVCHIGNFPDGESFVKVVTKGANQDEPHNAFIIHHLYPSPNERLMELLLMIDAAKIGGATKVSIFVPYFCYARQDRVTSDCSANSATLVCKLLKAAGADKISTIDIHNMGYFYSKELQVVGIFSPERAVQIILTHIRRKFSNAVIVSPDAGGERRARLVTRTFNIAGYNCKHAKIKKQRDDGGNVCDMKLLGDVNGKVCLIIDDIIAGGQTICKAADLLKEKGAREVLAYVTHPLLLGDAVKKINESKLDMLHVADTIPIEREIGSSKINVVPLLSTVTFEIFYSLTDL